MAEPTTEGQDRGGAFRRLERRVRSVIRLARARGAALALLASSLALAGAFLAVSFLDIAMWLPAPARLVLLAGAVALAGWAAFRARRGAPRDEHEASRVVEEHYREVGSSLSTAMEYGSDPAKTDAYSSREIVESLVETTEERTRPLRFRKAVDWRRLAKVGGALAGAGIVILVYALLLPHMASSTARRFLNPFSDAPPPTWTVIESVEPGRKELPRGESVAVKARLAGARAESVRLLYRGVDEKEWLSSEMSPDPAAAGERSYLRTLKRVVRPTEYRVIAGDRDALDSMARGPGMAQSPVYRLIPVEEPRVDSIRVRVTPPKYTGLGPEELPEGTGDVRALEGSDVEILVRTNRDPKALETAALDFEAGEATKVSIPLEPVPSDKPGEAEAAEKDAASTDAGSEGRLLGARFKLYESGRYRVRLVDRRGRTNTDRAEYRLTALPDRPPKVRVTEPGRDVMAFRNQEVTVKAEASDDYGLAEVGLVHTLSGSPERTPVDRPAKGTKEKSVAYPARLGLRSFEGGEIVTYYGYAVDSKGTESKGEMRFLRTYDEEKYGQMPGMMRRRQPRAVREIEKLIKRQMRVTRDTFGLSRPGAGEAEGAPAARPSGGETPAGERPADRKLARAAGDQEDLREDLQGLIREIEEEMARPPAEAGRGEARPGEADPDEAGADAAAEGREAGAGDTRPGDAGPGEAAVGETAAGGRAAGPGEEPAGEAVRDGAGEGEAAGEKAVADGGEPVDGPPGDEAGGRPSVEPGAEPGGQTGGEPGVGPGIGPVPGEPGMRPREMAHLDSAAKKMKAAAEALRGARPGDAFGPQSEALAHLSKTRRILLSDSASGDMQMAMERANRRRETKRQNQRRRNLDQFQRQMEKLPPILEREEAARRKLEELEDEPPPPARASELANEQRELAEAKRDLAESMDQQGRDDPGMPEEPQRRLLESADMNERAARQIERGRPREAAGAAASAARETSAAERAGRQSMRSMDQERMQGGARSAQELAREQKELARRSDAEASREDEEAARKEAGRLAERQDDVRERFEKLKEEVGSLAERARSEGRPEARSLGTAEMRQEAARTSGRMEDAARELRAGRPGNARYDQTQAARSLEELAGDLRRASRAAKASEQERLAEVVRRAEEFAKDVGKLHDSARDPAADPKAASSRSRELGTEAKELASAASLLPRKGEASDLKQAEESFGRAGRRLEDAGDALERGDRPEGQKQSLEAREEAARAAEALKREASGDLARSLAQARDAARSAAGHQSRAKAQAEGARDSGERAASSRLRTGAARDEREAEGEAREAEGKLRSAANAAKDLGGRLAEWVAREAARAERDGLGGRMGELASRLEEPAPGDDGSEGARDVDERKGEADKDRAERLGEEAREASTLAKQARDAASRLASLAAEARGDEVEALRAAGEDAKEMARRMRELEGKIGEFRRDEESPDRGARRRSARGRPSDRGAGEDRAEKSRRLGAEARDVGEDEELLRKRLERRAGEILRRATEGREGREGRKAPEKEIEQAAKALQALSRALSRNQPLPRPTSALRSGALAYQIVGEGVIAKLERILKQRDYRPPEDEEAPAGYRELVDRYFRALSEE